MRPRTPGRTPPAADTRCRAAGAAIAAAHPAPGLPAAGSRRRTGLHRPATALRGAAGEGTAGRPLRGRATAPHR